MGSEGCGTPTLVLCTLARLRGQEEPPKGRIWNIPMGTDGQDGWTDGRTDGGQEETVDRTAEGNSRLAAQGMPAPVGGSRGTLGTHESWLETILDKRQARGWALLPPFELFPCVPEG